MIRSIWVYAVGLVSTPMWASYAILISLFGRSRVTCRCSAIARRWSRRLMQASGSTVSVQGLEDFDPDEPRILIANHQSWFDVMALCGWLPGNFRFVAKKELARIPIFGTAWQRCGHVSIDRGDLNSAIDSLQTAAERVARDKLTIAVFPEGTRSSDGKLKSFKKGAFVLAIRAGVPLVPVAIQGTRDIMRKGRWRIGRGQVHLRIGRPISTAGYTLDDRDRLRDDAFAALRALLDEEAGEAASSPSGAAPSHPLQRKQR